MRYVMVPGIGGSDVDHWQSWWERELGPDASRISPVSWDAPDEADWLDAIGERVDGGAVLVAHSLGCLAVTTWLACNPSSDVAGAFLVAPPDLSRPSFPAAASSFSVASARMPVPTLVVASSDDPYGSLVVAREFATAWGASFIDAGALGHINGESDLGSWRQGRDLLAAFTAGLGPEV